MKRLLILWLGVCLPVFFSMAAAQEEQPDQDVIDDNTRANLILDIAKYVQYDESFEDLDEFSITILDVDDELYWSVERLAQTRQFIQGKPVRVYLYPKVDMLEPTQVVYFSSENGYKVDRIKDQIEGWNTLMVSEGYPFRESMINFLVVDGKPRFEANEELMNEHDLQVDELFLAHAIKTRSDWEELFEVTEVELEEEKEITRQQRIVIAEQDSMIQAQLERLKALGEQIMQKERELEEKIRSLVQKEQEVEVKDREIEEREQEIRLQAQKITEQQEEVEQQQQVLDQQQAAISEKEEVIEARDSEIRAQEEKIALQLESLQKQKIVIIAAVIALLLLTGLAYFIYVNYRNKKKANRLLEEKNEKITAQNVEIKKQKELAEMQRDQIAYQKKHITDSIEYAQKIQRAILPSLELFSDEIDHFVLYKPRDIVSGDFYWVDKMDNKQIIIAADCTGHGVPGAFMSMLGVSLLNEIINNRQITDPDKILNTLRSFVIDSLNQQAEESEVKDGMDMTVTIIDYNTDTLYYAGANNPLYHIRNGELTQYKADKMPVSIHARMDPFTLHKLDLQKGDTFYTFSDGYVDQFGGPNQKKFLAKNFRKVLLEIQDMPMIDQGRRLDEIFEEYRKDVEQVDDVVVIGIRY